MAAPETSQNRRDFFHNLYSYAPTSPLTDLVLICKYWRAALNADWVWFWLFNDLTKQWQLLASCPDDDIATVPSILSVQSSASVSEYVNVKKQPEWITDLANWRGENGDKKFKVALLELLGKMACAGIQCVPLLPPTITGNDIAAASVAKLRMAVCCHFKNPKSRIEHDAEKLLMMGRASAQAVMNSYLMEQRAAIMELTSTATVFLTQKSDRPLLLRQTYANKLIEIIRDKLSVKYVSVFYRTSGGATLECLASTGLFRESDKSKLSNEKISTAVYRQGEGYTWKVFESGNPYLSLIDQPKNGAAVHKYRELPFDVDETKESWIIYPIIDPQSANQPHVNLGVIRCVATSAHLCHSPACNLDQMQILLLDCIAQQSGFALEALTASVNREKTISTVRHDLLAPVQMIRDTVEGMLPDPMPFHEEIPNHLKDLLFSSVTAFHLIPLLDPNPVEIPECSLLPVLLSGEIVARLKAMLTPFARRQSDMKISFGDFSKIPAVKVDRVLLERVMYNLIMNAIKYGARGSEIQVIPTLAKDGVIIGVMNYGVGISEDEKDDIFEGSYRSPKFAKKLGLGVGLKIARAAMSKQGGDLKLSQLSNPTIFSIIIPRKLIE